VYDPESKFPETTIKFELALDAGFIGFDLRRMDPWHF